MVVLMALGLGLLAANVALVYKRDAVISRVTSRSLGSLAPGFAATKVGFNVYAGLVGDVGLALLCVALGYVWLILASVGLFVLGSIIAIAGEVAVYRNLKR